MEALVGLNMAEIMINSINKVEYNGILCFWPMKALEAHNKEPNLQFTKVTLTNIDLRSK